MKHWTGLVGPNLTLKLWSTHRGGYNYLGPLSVRPYLGVCRGEVKNRLSSTGSTGSSEFYRHLFSGAFLLLFCKAKNKLKSSDSSYTADPSKARPLLKNIALKPSFVKKKTVKHYKVLIY